MISCFNIQEAGDEEERGIDQSSVVKVSRGGRKAGRDERGQGERWRGRGDERRNRMERRVE